MTSISAWSRSPSRWRAGRVPVIAGAGSNSTAEAIDLARHAQQGRRGRRAGGDALLQQADAGRPVPALHGDRRRGGHSDDHLQHSRPQRRRHERRDHGAAGASTEHRRREGRDRQPDPPAAHRAAPAAPSSASSPARTTRRSPSSPPAAHGCISRHRQCRAAALQRDARGLAATGALADAMAIQDRLLPLHDAHVRGDRAPAR